MFHKYPSIDQFEKVQQYLESQMVLVQEKVDGTNVSMHFHNGICDLWGRTQPIDRAKPGMYKPFVDWFSQHEEEFLYNFENAAWPWNTIFYGELINTNKLRYALQPPMILFDYVCYNASDVELPVHDPYDYLYNLIHWSNTFGVPLAKMLYLGFCDMMPSISNLIGPSHFDHTITMEGIVIKAFDVDIPYEDEEGNPKLSHKQRLYGKYVRPEFREVHREKNEASDPIQKLAQRYGTEPRLDKAIQKAREQGLDYESNRGILIKLALEDIEAEEGPQLTKEINDLFGKLIRKQIGTTIMRLYNERSNIR